ncbi:MAG: DUF4040 domain-containing protein [Elusimicrobia bacterium]|nr:DUF4040 domain-containing protein [Candidatus Obscuribacterium magneticum]
MVELYILFGFMIISALVAIELDDLVSSVIAVSAVGLGLSMAFIVLKAPDVAFTQLVVELLCLIILIRSTIKRDLPFSTSGRWYINTSIAVFFMVAFGASIFKVLQELPEFGSPIMRVSQTYLNEGFIQTGATNIVSAILLNYRAYDRLGEATVLIIALVGVVSLLRQKGRKGKDETVQEKMD